jgi:uncharacterized membrane protein YcgQ (UPF0703/DUF1980 family)
MKRLILVFVTSLSLVSCGGSGGVTKDTKADFQLDIKDLTGLGATEKETERAKYVGKVIELKGFVKGARASKSSANPNKYFFYLVGNMQDDDFTGTIIHTDTDATALEGQAVTVKGALEYAGAISLKNSAVY